MRKSAFGCLLLIFCLAPAFGQVAIKGRKVYTMAGPVIENGVVLMRGKTIEKVGAGLAIPAGYHVSEAAVVTPGLIDAHSVVGLAGHLNQPQDQDQLEKSAPIQPQLRAIDAYDARGPLVTWLREFGVTTIHTGHGPGALVSGQTLIAKTSGDNVTEAVTKHPAMLAMTLGSTALAEDKKSPGTRSKMVAMLRAEFIRAREYRDKLEKAPEDKRPARDLGLEVLVQALAGELPVLVTVHRVRDIQNALRLAEEFKLKLVLDGAAEGYLIAGDIAAAGVPVILHPTMARARGETENLTLEAAARLRRAGVAIAFQSGFEGYVPKTRVVLFEAAIAAANGLSFEEALAGITSDAARILGIQDRVGSLEQGKDGDLVLFDGDPFEYTTHVTAVFINGRQVSQTPR